MVLLKATKSSEAGVMPDEKLLTAMGAFNEELVKAGVMVSGEGLHPTSRGRRVRLAGGKQTVENGPFSPTGEQLAGFWIWRVASMEEAVGWAKRCPHPMPGDEAIMDLRTIFEVEDFGEAMTPELRAQEDRLRDEVERQAKA